MPTNLYGKGDNYHAQNSHVIPALIRKFHEAKIKGSSEVEIWGTGTPLREFMFVDDLADASVYLMKNYNGKLFVNVGTGIEITIRELAYIIKDIVRFNGTVVFNSTKPDGTPRKLMDSSFIHSLGWKHKTSFEEGIKATYEFFCDEIKS